MSNGPFMNLPQLAGPSVATSQRGDRKAKSTMNLSVLDEENVEASQGTEAKAKPRRRRTRDVVASLLSQQSAAAATSDSGGGGWSSAALQRPSKLHKIKSKSVAHLNVFNQYDNDSSNSSLSETASASQASSKAFKPRSTPASEDTEAQTLKNPADSKSKGKVDQPRFIERFIRNGPMSKHHLP